MDKPLRKQVRCKVCGGTAAQVLDHACGSCLKKEPERIIQDIIRKAHTESRRIPPVLSPQDPRGVTCYECGNLCRIKEGEYGFCRLRQVQNKRIHSKVTGREAVGIFYFDPLPTNCVADWVCPGSVGAGYPQYAYSPGPEYGYKNLAIFFGACSFDCLYCQNRSCHEMAIRGKPLFTIDEITESLDDKSACICFFGGDPSPQMSFALSAAKEALKEKKGEILRICWETNGNIHPKYLDDMVKTSLSSGGIIKFDLKAWDEKLHRILTGASNRQTFKNFKYIYREYFDKRTIPPLLVASTLLIPGYIGEAEVKNIANFLVKLNPQIPYTLLAFSPQHMMTDLPLLTWEEANECLEAAKRMGLERVRLGNTHLLR